MSGKHNIFCRFNNFWGNKSFFKTFPILWLDFNLGYTTSKANKEKVGGFQRKPVTFCESTNFSKIKCRKSLVEKMVSFP